jgi:hypothetical protein
MPANKRTSRQKAAKRKGRTREKPETTPVIRKGGLSVKTGLRANGV